ncbi:MAG: universal stress protein [Candidatus Dormibacteria bacterium]
MHEVIVVAVDGSKGGYAAVVEAAEIAKRFGAGLIAISVEEGLPRYAGTLDEVDDFVERKDKYFADVGREAERLAGEHGVTITHEVRLGHSADVIVKFVEEVNADLVVLGYKGHSRIAQSVIGTTAQKVNAYSKASVLIVKPTDDTESLWR